METDFSSFSAITAMEPISLKEMDSVKLMNRIDTKYFTTEEILRQVFVQAAVQGYRICQIDGHRVTRYDSMYYDTDDLRMYRTHRSGRSVRQKIRVRIYLVSGVSFLEIKRKDNKGRTKKKRMLVPAEYAESIEKDKEAAEFVDKQSWFTLEDLSPACRTDFNRITLVNKEKTERVTFDTDLLFQNPRTGKTVEMGDAVIIEVKQDGRVPSVMSVILRNLRVHPFKVSKYCIGTTLTDPLARPERFKPKILRIEKIINRNFER